MTALFQRRHYEWLAAFARAELPIGDRIALRNALARECVNFDADKFDRASGAAEWLAGARAALVHSATPDMNYVPALSVAQIRKQQREARRIRRVGYP